MNVKFNKRSRLDLTRLGNYMHRWYLVEAEEDLATFDTGFCRAVMYWHRYYVEKDWILPAWAHEDRFKQWIAAFEESYNRERRAQRSRRS